MINNGREAINRFRQDLVEQCHKNKVTLKLEASSKVKYSNDETIWCRGYFDSDEKNLALVVATKCKPELWLSTLVHESCHLDQHLENCKVWKGWKLSHVMGEWLDGKEFSKTELNEAFKQTVAVELDCEKRSIEKIKYYHLPLDLDRYIQMTNLYMHFHNWVKQNRKWNPKSRNLYTEKLIKLMPTTLQKSYNKTPQNVLDAMSKHFNIK